MGLHTGEPISANEGYVGIDVHMAARICAAGHGGQVLVSQMSHDLIGSDLPSDVSLIDLGEHRLKDIIGLQRLYQVAADGLSREFGPLRTSGGRPSNLPRELTSFVGRDRQLADAGAILRVSPLLTLVGPGGVGKSRLGLRLAADHLDDYDEGAWLVELGTVVDADLVLETIATTLGVVQQPGRDLSASVLDHLRSGTRCSSSTAASTSSVPRRRPSAGSSPPVPASGSWPRAARVSGSPARLLCPVPSMSLPESERQVTAAELDGPRRSPVRGPGDGRPARLPGHVGQRAGDRPAVPPARRDPARARARRGPDPGPVRRSDRSPARRPVPAADRREPGCRCRASRPCAPRWTGASISCPRPSAAVLLRLAGLRRQPVARGRRARLRLGPGGLADVIDLLSRLVEKSLVGRAVTATAATGCSRRSACTPAIG